MDPLAETEEFTCKVGGVILHKGVPYWVNQVVNKGKGPHINTDGYPVFGERDCLAVCRIMPDNGHILKRSPIYIGRSWEHIPWLLTDLPIMQNTLIKYWVQSRKDKKSYWEDEGWSFSRGAARKYYIEMRVSNPSLLWRRITIA